MYCSIQEAMRRLGYSRATIYRLIDQGRLRIYRATPKSFPRLKIAELEALMKDEQSMGREPTLDELFAAADAHFGLPSRSKGKSIH